MRIWVNVGRLPRAFVFGSAHCALRVVFFRGVNYCDVLRGGDVSYAVCGEDIRWGKISCGGKDFLDAVGDPPELQDWKRSVSQIGAPYP